MWFYGFLDGVGYMIVGYQCQCFGLFQCCVFVFGEEWCFVLCDDGCEMVIGFVVFVCVGCVYVDVECVVVDL